MNRTSVLAMALLIFSVLSQAQETRIFKSRYLSLPDTVLIYKPDDYNAEKKYPLVILLHGYSQNYKQWSQTIDVQKLSNQYKMIIVTPDGFTSFYINSAFDKQSQWEDFFFKILFPKINKDFHIDTQNIFVSGLSMGGYGALSLFLSYPDFFNTACSTSGALEINYTKYEKISRHFWHSNRLTKDAVRIFGNPGSTNWQQNNIYEILKRKKIRKPFLIDCGTEDPLYPFTYRLKILADNMKLPLTFIAQPGNHNTEYWHKSIEQHFIYFGQHLKN
ncbi:MAG: alpha/beta hydrolase-fold protein [Arachidicoccus sp.]|nr:alpha/beta hydrolase-fold protein [Arachidicoccus sp.]